MASNVTGQRTRDMEQDLLHGLAALSERVKVLEARTSTVFTFGRLIGTCIFAIAITVPVVVTAAVVVKIALMAWGWIF